MRLRGHIVYLLFAYMNFFCKLRRKIKNCEKLPLKFEDTKFCYFIQLKYLQHKALIK